MTASLWSTERGDGVTVVIVHGTMDRSTSFGRVVRVLDELRVVRYDRRGYGRSRRAGVPASFPAQVEDLEAVLDDHASGGPAVVVGHSYGGVIALAAAARDAEIGRIAALCVYECPLPWLPWWPSHGPGARPLGDGDPGDAAESFMRRMLGDERWSKLPPSTRADRRAEGATFVAEIDQLRTMEPVDLAAVAVPVVAAAGSEAADRHRQSIEVVAASAPRAELVILDGVGHGVHLSHPTAFAGIIRRAVDRSAQPGPRSQ